MSELIHKELAFQVVGAAMAVHSYLGCGFLEKVYRNALMIELKQRNLRCAMEVPITILYDGQPIGDYIADILVEDKIILELKAV